MIGTELLQLLQGDPLAQMRQQMGGPNPNPQAPPPRPVAPAEYALAHGQRSRRPVESGPARLWGRRRRCRQAYPPIR